MDNRFILIGLFIFILAALFAIVVHMALAVKKHESLKSSNSFQNLENYRAEIDSLINEIDEARTSRESIKEYIRKSEEYKNKVITGVMSLDALLNYKVKVCEAKKITLEYMIVPFRSRTMEDKEYVSLFGNLLDNAIEAAEMTETRHVCLESKELKGMWVIKITNSKLSDAMPLENNMKTTKADEKNHGIGTKVIKSIVDKHDGSLAMQDKGDSFEVVIGIPVNKENRYA